MFDAGVLNGQAVLRLILGLVVMLSFVLLGIVAGQALAQDDDDPLADETATIADTDEDEIPNTVTITVADCTVDQDAIVVVDDPNGTEVTLTNGENVDITATANDISITGTTGADENIGASDEFDSGAGTVVSSTGITCEADTTTPTVSEDDNDTTIINVPKKPLPKTGGAAPVSLTGVLAYGAAIFAIPMLCVTFVFLAQRFKDRRGW